MLVKICNSCGSKTKIGSPLKFMATNEAYDIAYQICKKCEKKYDIEEERIKKEARMRIDALKRKYRIK